MQNERSVSTSRVYDVCSQRAQHSEHWALNIVNTVWGHRFCVPSLRRSGNDTENCQRNLEPSQRCVATLYGKPPPFISEFIVQLTEKASKQCIPCAPRVTRSKFTRRRDCVIPHVLVSVVRDSNFTVNVSCLQLALLLPGIGVSCSRLPASFFEHLSMAQAVHPSIQKDLMLL